MSAPDNPPAFPVSSIDGFMQHGMELRDWFAGQAPAPREAEIAMQEALDRGRNPHNEPHKPKLRSRDEIVAALRYRLADAMLAERMKR